MAIGKLSKFIKAKIDRAFPGETVDPTPIAPPIGYKKQPTIWEQQRAMIRAELSRQAEAQGFETFEESDDFDVGDDFDPHTPYEADFEPDTSAVRDAFSPAPAPTAPQAAPWRPEDANSPEPPPAAPTAAPKA